jgi:hypothetical protein
MSTAPPTAVYRFPLEPAPAARRGLAAVPGSKWRLRPGKPGGWQPCANRHSSNVVPAVEVVECAPRVVPVWFLSVALGMLGHAVRPHRKGGAGLAGFLFRLETADGRPAEPPTLSSAISNWSAGDCIYLGKRTLRVIGETDDDADQPPVLVVEDVALTAQR